MRLLSRTLRPLIEVVRGKSDGDFTSKLISKARVPKGGLIAKVEGYEVVPVKRWSTVQVSETSHIELNSDLVFMNHSCDPSAYFDASNMEVTAMKALKEGDEITFFYPSTEWQMAQPFPCWCGAPNCLKSIHGAEKLSADAIEHHRMNSHILKLLNRRDSGILTP